MVLGRIAPKGLLAPRRGSGWWQQAAACLIAGAFLTAPRAAELVLPAPAAPTPVTAASLRVDATPRPDGALDALVTLALVNPGTSGQQVQLRLPALPRSSADVGGQPVPPPAGDLLLVDVEAAEALVVRITFRVDPDLLDWLPEPEAGWIGRTRGPLLEPAFQLVVRHPEGSAFGAAPVSVRVAPGGDLPVSAIFQVPPGRLATGEASWEGVSIPPPARLVVSWPVLARPLLPRDRVEAEALAAALGDSDVATPELERLRDAIASSGEPGAPAAAGVIAAMPSGPERARDRARPERERPARDDATAAAARERSEREAAAAATAAREQSEREAAAVATAAREQSQREAAAVAAREQSAREAAAAAARKQSEREAAAVVAPRARSEREAAAAAARGEQAEREAAAAVARERAEREAAPEIIERREALETAALEAQERDARETLERMLRSQPPGAIPWIRSASHARAFLALEREASTLETARVETAIATIRAHWGESFRYEPRWRKHFADAPWYAPRREGGLLPATQGEIAALEVLAAAM